MTGPTGKFLLGKNFVKQNWNKGFDEKGRPIKDPAVWPKPMGGILIEPGNQGGTNWYPPSFSPRTGLFYIPTWENSGGLSRKGDPGPWVEGQRYTGTGQHRGARGRAAAAGGTRRRGRAAADRRGPVPITKRKTKATERSAPSTRKTGDKKWDFKMVNYTENGVLSTGGDLVFGGGMEGNFVALDARTGELLWHVNLGGPKPAARSATRSTGSNTLSEPAKAPCSRSPYRISAVPGPPE